LWPDRLCVSLAPESVAAVRVTGLLRPRVSGKWFLDCDRALGAEPWRGALAALEALLRPLSATAMKATVVLSNRFVRYAVVPFDPGISGPEQEVALARFHFVRVHGERAKGWEVRVSDGPHGTARLAGAIDGGLLADIRKCFPRKGRVRLVSVQPYLMAAFRRARTQLAKTPAWLVLPERERSCLALALPAGWQAVQMPRFEADDEEEWRASLERARLQAGEAAPAAALVLGAPPKRVLSGWNVSALAPPALDGCSPLEDGRYAMALAAR
jgi:hypothetical protein